MSAIQDEDKPRVKRAYLKAIGIISFVTFPMMVGLFVVANHFVLALLGTQWSEVIPILKLFCWVGLIQSVLATVGWIYTSQGQTRLYFTMGVIGASACLVAFVIGVHWGVMGVAWAYSLTTAIVLFPFFTIPARLIDLSFWEAAEVCPRLSSVLWPWGQSFGVQASCYLLPRPTGCFLQSRSL